MGLKPKIEAVIFDAYGTLFDVYSVASLADEIFPGKGGEIARIWRERQIDYTRIRTLCDQYVDFRKITEDALSFACNSLNLELSADNKNRLMDQYDHLSAFPENLGVLDQLKSQGLQLGILSNGTTGMIDGAIQSAEMEGYFDHILTVENIRKYKTVPEVYQLGPDAFCLDVSQILFVSSNCWDACGATWFGYQTLWVNRADMPVEVLGVDPCATGKKLDAVLDYLN